MPALADDDTAASDSEKKLVQNAIAKINCKADEIEKENADLFEIDDAVYDIGQYDIKLNGKYEIISLTRD